MEPLTQCKRCFVATVAPATLGLGLVLGLGGCRTAADACADFIAAVEECEGHPDDYYNQAYCDQNAEAGCDDRKYYDCMADDMTCVNGEADTTPISCSFSSAFSCALGPG
jgi:hypothetical protein